LSFTQLKLLNRRPAYQRVQLFKRAIAAAISLFGFHELLSAAP
jgi:hypothetical protein